MTSSTDLIEPGAAEVGSLSARTGILLASAFMSVTLISVMLLLPVRYAILRPGPAINTLGKSGNKQLIEVSGHTTYPTGGALDLTTVTILGGPASRLSLIPVISGWFDQTVEVVPEEVIYPPGQSAQQSHAQNQQEMSTSQEDATAAALTALGICVPTTVTITVVDPQAPSAAVLRADDEIISIAGRRQGCVEALHGALHGVRAGDPVPVVVRRAGTLHTLSVKTKAADDGRTILGIYLAAKYHFPFQVKIQIEDVGGPSAGTMLALGIIDTLTPGELTGGRQIAGTGTIDPDGTVGPIGGIRQKLVGARKADAQWFLAPAEDCVDVRGHVPDGLRVVKISTLQQARSAVEVIASGRGTEALPTC